MITMYALSCVTSQDDMIALGSVLGYIFGVNIGGFFKHSRGLQSVIKSTDQYRKRTEHIAANSIYPNRQRLASGQSTQ